MNGEQTGLRDIGGQPAARAQAPSAPEVDVAALESELRAELSGEVRFDIGSRALYATDGSNYRQVPIGVVVPRSTDDVIATVEVCRRHGAPLLSRGGGTSLAGQCCNVAVVMDHSKYLHHVLELDPERRFGRVQPGCILDDLRQAAVRYDLTFGPDPATHTHNTLGGMIGNNSCGPHSVMAGRTAENVLELDVLTYDGLRLRVGPTGDDELRAIIAAGGRRGQIYADMLALRDRHADEIRRRFPRIPRRVSGYNLDSLLPEAGFDVARALTGSEGTLVTILEAKLRLIPWPRSRSLLVLGYPDIYSAGDHVTEIMRYEPLALEGLDDRLIEYMRKKGLHDDYIHYLPPGRGFLMVEFGGDTKEESDAVARRAMDRLRSDPVAPTMKLYDNPDQEQKLWEVRESGLGATARIPGEPDTWEGWEDSAVPPEKLGTYLRELRHLFARHGYTPSLYGHFGQACVHCRVNFDLKTAAGIDNYRSFIDDATDLVVRLGGSFSGEHGDGQSRAEWLPKMFGPQLIRAFEELKAIWDPAWRMNPGKVVRPNGMTDNLRLGTSFSPRQVTTHFQYPEDDHDFTRATLRCVGVGKCRTEREGTMCPSYQATREEMHSTRGRAHLLFEMMRGSELDGWRDDHVRESLDLCLACKGCKGECPINVDVATYKAEFLSHYYEHRVRPRQAYSMGLVMLWARLGALVPGLANFVTRTPGLAWLFKKLGGIDPRRQVPAFAGRTFRDYFRQRRLERAPGPDAPRVILWADTFNNHFFPGTGLAAAEVLERGGFDVVVPREHLCCGRPLYDFGMLGLAKRYLRRVLEVLREPIRAGVPIVGLEPSCVSVFRDELPNLFPNDRDALRMSEQTFLLGEFVGRHADRFELPALPQRALVHGHCHHKSLFKLHDEEEVLRRLGVDFTTLDSGCCGMAGSFGFEQGEKYDVSMAVGEQRLLPAVRDAGDSTIIVADGFSCREQVRQSTERTPMHLAEVMRMALRRAEDGTSSSPEPFPEQRHAGHQRLEAYLDPRRPAAVGAVALLLGAGLALLQRLRRRRRGRLAAVLAGITGVGALAMAAEARRQRNAAANGRRRWPFLSPRRAAR